MFDEDAALKFHLKQVQSFIEAKFREHFQPLMLQWNWITATEIDATTILLNGKARVSQECFQIKYSRFDYHCLVEITRLIVASNLQAVTGKRVEKITLWSPFFITTSRIRIEIGLLFENWFQFWKAHCLHLDCWSYLLDVFSDISLFLDNANSLFIRGQIWLMKIKINRILFTYCLS